MLAAGKSQSQIDRRRPRAETDHGRSVQDIHLYHFLLRYPGRTIVFLSAIDGIRRLFPLLSLLEFNVQQLHSGMQQRARLKSLDRWVRTAPDSPTRSAG